MMERREAAARERRELAEEPAPQRQQRWHQEQPCGREAERSGDQEVVGDSMVGSALLAGKEVGSGEKGQRSEGRGCALPAILRVGPALVQLLPSGSALVVQCTSVQCIS